MSDLVEHLRWKGHQQGDSKLLEAADEIERLQAVVDAARVRCREKIAMSEPEAEEVRHWVLWAVVDILRTLDGEVKP